MAITLHQPHDKFFKRNLKEKKIAIDVLKAYLSPEIYKQIEKNATKSAGAKNNPTA